MLSSAILSELSNSRVPNCLSVLRPTYALLYFEMYFNHFHDLFFTSVAEIGF